MARGDSALKSSSVVSHENNNVYNFLQNITDFNKKNMHTVLKLGS